jgi:hypothetical protein
MRSEFLIFDTDFTAQLKKANVKDGKVVIGNKEFLTDKAHPFSLKTFAGTRPLYLLKWNALEPMKFEVKEAEEAYIRTVDGKEEKITVVKKDLVPVDPKFDEKSKIIPEILKTTQDSRFLKAMKRYAGGKAGIFGEEGAGSMLPLVLGVAGGAILVYLMFALKLLVI